EARVGTDDGMGIDRPQFRLGGGGGVAEDQVERGIRGDGGGGLGADRADVDAFVNRLEQPRKRRRASIHWNSEMRNAECGMRNAITELPERGIRKDDWRTTLPCILSFVFRIPHSAFRIASVTLAAALACGRRGTRPSSSRWRRGCRAPTRRSGTSVPRCA